MLASVTADIVYSAVNEDRLMTETLRRRDLRTGRHYRAGPFTSAKIGAIMTASIDAQRDRHLRRRPAQVRREAPRRAPHR